MWSVGYIFEKRTLKIILVFHVKGRNKADMWSAGYMFEKKTKSHLCFSCAERKEVEKKSVGCMFEKRIKLSS